MVDVLACCNIIEPDGVLCTGKTRLRTPVYVCDTCGAQCGYLVHPTHAQPVEETPSKPYGFGLLSTETGEPDPMITGGVDFEVEVIEIPVGEYDE